MTRAVEESPVRNPGSPVRRQALISLPIELTNGNTGRTKHWTEAYKRRREYEATLRLLHPHPRPVRTPVHLTITRVLGRNQRLMDADSLGRGNAKEIIDAIVAVGILPDDGPRHVVEVTYRQDDTRRRWGPRVDVTIEAIP